METFSGRDGENYEDDTTRGENLRATLGSLSTAFASPQSVPRSLSARAISVRIKRIRSIAASDAKQAARANEVRGGGCITVEDDASSFPLAYTQTVGDSRSRRFFFFFCRTVTRVRNAPRCPAWFRSLRKYPDQGNEDYPSV